MILEMALRGIGLSGDTTDLEEGTEIFARHNEKDMWNNGYIRRIDRLCWDKGLESVNVAGFYLTGRSSSKAGDTRCTAELQTPRVVRLRTCPHHRQRVAMIHNENVRERWCTGTPCRLLSTQSWTDHVGAVEQHFEKTTLRPASFIWSRENRNQN